MAAYRRVYDSRHLQADCQEPGSAPEPHARQSIEYGLPRPLRFTCRVQKLVTQKVRRTRLNACIGDFPPDVDPPPEQFVYFARVSDSMVPVPNSAAEADDQMPAYFDIGVVSGHSLEMLQLLLTQVNTSIKNTIG